MKNTFIKYDDQLNEIDRKRFACGTCGKKRRRKSKEAWVMVDRHDKIIWKNKAYKELERKLK